MVGLYWWRDGDSGKNLGDEITNIIFKDLFGASFKRASYPGADVLGAGSILGWVYERTDMKVRPKTLHVCGSGLMHPWVSPEKLDYVKFHLVRGHLTKNFLSGIIPADCGLGDPGLLISELVDESVLLKARENCKYEFGLIPHISRVEDPAFFEKFSKIESLKLIDFRTDDAHGVAREMLECRVILSQGLHGLIFSDSLGIPNVWVNTGALHKGAEFKFYDYFSSVGRPFGKKLDVRKGPVLIDDIYCQSVHPLGELNVEEVRSDIKRQMRKVLSEFDPVSLTASVS